MHAPGNTVLMHPATADGFMARLDTSITYALQPIVNIHTGVCYGYEALLRGHAALGFPTIGELFDHAHRCGFLHEVDMRLREKAIQTFVSVDRSPESKLFFNLDPRVLDSRDYQPRRTRELLARNGLYPAAFCFELSERHNSGGSIDSARVLDVYRAQTFKLAVDDFGTGFSGLRLLYDHQPDLIKIDRFFVADIDKDNRKRLFVSTIVNLAHVLGIAVVAEGVETELELLTCKKVGCDLAQGYLIERPTERIDGLHRRYQLVDDINRRDRRHDDSDQKIIYEQIEFLPPLKVDENMKTVFEAFLQNRTLTFFPVIDANGEPVGIVRESDFKSYAYSPFGKDLISNKAFGKRLGDFVTKCPIADINTEAERILEIYSLNENPEGIIIVHDFAYVGFLTAASLLRVINSKNLALARDQNPLTKLPGNNTINDWVGKARENDSATAYLCYMDFDNFKPFNDTYGFRQGDRAILLFAELMRKRLSGMNAFLGHVGGDDFFAGFSELTFDEVSVRLRDLLETFRQDVVSFYEPQVQKDGCLLAKDREGNSRCFPLLACSAALLELPAGRPRTGIDEIVELIFKMKKEAKNSPDKVCMASLV